MTRHARILIPVFCFVIAFTSNAFGQLRKYTESFEKDRQSNPKIVETLQPLKTSHSKLNKQELVEKLNEWGASHEGEKAPPLPKATFMLKDEVIVMKVFWGEDIESKPEEVQKSEGMKHCLGVANDIMKQWNKDRSFGSVQFAGVELVEFLYDAKVNQRQDVDPRKYITVASPEVLILVK